MRTKTFTRVGATLSITAALLLTAAVTPKHLTAEANDSPSASKPIPKHLVYRHFLSMVSYLQDKATARGDKDPYSFARSFSRARLENIDLDLISAEARALKTDLATTDEKAKPLIEAYRVQARAAIQQGLSLPPVPATIYQLQAERLAISINHMTRLQAALGTEKTGKLESYFAREFTPHVSVRALSHLRTDIRLPQNPDFAPNH